MSCLVLCYLLVDRFNRKVFKLVSLVIEIVYLFYEIAEPRRNDSIVTRVYLRV